MTKPFDKVLQNQIKSEIEARRKEERALAMQTEAEQVRELGLIPDGKGGKVSLRDQWRQEVKQAIEQDVNSYHDWRAAILGLIKMYTSFASTNQQLLKENVYLPVKHLFLTFVGYPLVGKIADVFCGIPEVALPALLQHAEVDAEGLLSVNLSRADGGDVGDLNQLLHQGVTAWLRDHHFTQDPQTHVFKNGNEVLTAERFNELKEEQHLNDYLSNYSSDIRPRP